MTDPRTLERRLERLYLASGGPSDWYALQRADIRRMAARHEVTVRTAAGVVAALSPRIQWCVNLRWADAVLDGRPSGGFGPQVRKARRIADGERPLTVLRGPKERSFYRNLTGDPHAVTVDVWMARAFGIDPGTVGRSYAVLERIVRRVAARHGVYPADLQASVWTHVRGRAS